MPQGLQTKARQKGKIKSTLIQAVSTDIALGQLPLAEGCPGDWQALQLGVGTEEGILLLSAGHRGGRKSCHAEQQPPEMSAVVLSWWSAIIWSQLVVFLEELKSAPPLRRKEERTVLNILYLIKMVLELSAEGWRLWSLDTTGQSPRKWKNYVYSTIQPKLFPKLQAFCLLLFWMSQRTWHTLKTSHLFLSSSSPIML